MLTGLAIVLVLCASIEKKDSMNYKEWKEERGTTSNTQSGVSLSDSVSYKVINANFSDKITLLGYDISKEKVRPGDTVYIRWYLKITEATMDSCSISIDFWNNWKGIVFGRKIEIAFAKRKGEEEVFMDSTVIVWPAKSDGGRHAIRTGGGMCFTGNISSHLKLVGIPECPVWVYRERKLLILGVITVE